MVANVLLAFKFIAATQGLSEENYYMRAVALGDVPVLESIKAEAIFQGDVTFVTEIDSAIRRAGAYPTPPAR
jgi:hypothetical protein